MRVALKTRNKCRYDSWIHFSAFPIKSVPRRRTFVSTAGEISDRLSVNQFLCQSDRTVAYGIFMRYCLVDVITSEIVKQVFSFSETYQLPCLSAGFIRISRDDTQER
jgi:hypothetical protein